MTAGRATKRREPFAPNTGDRALDAFMLRKHDPKWRPLPLPKGQTFPIAIRRGGDRRPLVTVLAEAALAAEKAGWPGTYSGFSNPFLAEKRGMWTEGAS